MRAYILQANATEAVLRDFLIRALPPRVLFFACVVCAIAALGLAFMTSMNVSMDGFPDGHITDYEKATDAPLTTLAWVEAGFGLLFLALAFSPIGTRARAVGLLVALVAFIQLARSFYEPISDISEKYNILQSAMASSERIFKLLDEPVL